MSLKHEDLHGTVLPTISIDEFEAKAGDDTNIVVVAFYLYDQEPAEDLNTFIQRGFVDTIDVGTSPSTDEDGHYLVFVEMARDETFPNKFRALLKDVENITGKEEWKVRTYLSGDKTFDCNDAELYKFIMTDPSKYITKDKFMKESILGTVAEFLQESSLVHLTIDGNSVTLGAGGKKIIAEVVDIGEYDEVFGRNFLTESAFRLIDTPIEATVLGGMLGGYAVLPIENFLCISNQRDDRVMLLKNTEIKYRG